MTWKCCCALLVGVALIISAGCEPAKTGKTKTDKTGKKTAQKTTPAKTDEVKTLPKTEELKTEPKTEENKTAEA
jgi:hypothetical protein